MEHMDTRMHKHTHIYIHTYTCTHRHTHTNTDTCLHMCMYEHTHVHTHISKIHEVLKLSANKTFLTNYICFIKDNRKAMN